MKRILGVLLTLCLMLSLCAGAGAETAEPAATEKPSPLFSFRTRSATFSWKDATVTRVVIQDFDKEDAEYGSYWRVFVYVTGVSAKTPITIDDVAGVKEGEFRLCYSSYTNGAKWLGFGNLTIQVTADGAAYAQEQPEIAFAYQVPVSVDLDALTLECPRGESIPLNAVPCKMLAK